MAFDTADDKNAFMAVTAATSLTFFAMVGFEDSVNMAEETKDPVKIFPKMLLTGLSIVSIVAVALVPVGELEASDTPLARSSRPAGAHFKTPTILPVIGFLTSLYLVTPLSGRPSQLYILAGILILIGIVLFLRHHGDQPSGRDPRRGHHRPDAPWLGP